MLSIEGPFHGTGRANYYLRQAVANYYLNGGEPLGIWKGGLAEALGLKGFVVKKAFDDLMLGFKPDMGGPLVQNAGKEKRQSCWDFTFNAPKSVSVLWGISGVRERELIEKAHEKAVERTIEHAEKWFGFSRSGAQGKQLETAKLLWAFFLHGTSRAEDPHLHTHCLLFNLGLRADGTTGALHTKELYRQKFALGAFYQVQLASILSQELGLKIKSEAIGFSIEGVPRKLCDALSQRRAQIEEALKDKAAPTAIDAKNAAIKTRPKKKHTAREILHRKWKEFAEANGYTEEHVRQLFENQSALKQVPWERLFEKLAKRQLQQNIEPQVLLHASRFALRIGADDAAVEKAVQVFRERHGRPWPISISRKQLFPHAPDWSPAKKLSLPYIKIGEKKPKWGKVLKEYRLPGYRGAVIQIRKRKLFAKAPSWNPASKLELPAIKIWTGKYAKNLRPFAAKAPKKLRRVKARRERKISFPIPPLQPKLSPQNEKLKHKLRHSL